MFPNKYKNITFVSSNIEKFNALQKIFKYLNTPVFITMINVEVPEIQDMDIKKVAFAKATYAFDNLKIPLIIDDTGFYFEKFPLFPGTLSKHIAKTIGMTSLWQLCSDNPKAHCICCLSYCDQEGQVHLFLGTQHGNMIKPITTIINKNLLFSDCFMPHGHNKTYSQLQQYDYHEGHRLEAAQQFHNFLLNKLHG